jgi:hypothetical protein
MKGNGIHLVLGPLQFAMSERVALALIALIGAALGISVL